MGVRKQWGRQSSARAVWAPVWAHVGGHTVWLRTAPARFDNAKAACRRPTDRLAGSPQPPHGSNKLGINQAIHLSEYVGIPRTARATRLAHCHPAC
eukprot:357473-Chlamydomonas_euryale.AAC.6